MSPSGGDRVEIVGSRETRQQQGVGDGLGIGVSELGIVRFRKEVLPPLGCQKCGGGVGALECGLDLCTQEAGQRREILRQQPRPVRHDRGPAEEIAKQHAQVIAVDFRNGPASVLLWVVVEADDCPASLTTSIERPLSAVSVNQVRQALKLLPLRLVVRALQLRRIGPETWGLQLDISANQLIDMDRNIRPNLVLR